MVLMMYVFDCPFPKSIGGNNSQHDRESSQTVPPLGMGSEIIMQASLFAKQRLIIAHNISLNFKGKEQQNKSVLLLLTGSALP